MVNQDIVKQQTTSAITLPSQTYGLTSIWGEVYRLVVPTLGQQIINQDLVVGRNVVTFTTGDQALCLIAVTIEIKEGLTLNRNFNATSDKCSVAFITYHRFSVLISLIGVTLGSTGQDEALTICIVEQLPVGINAILKTVAEKSLHLVGLKSMIVIVEIIGLTFTNHLKVTGRSVDNKSILVGLHFSRSKDNLYLQILERGSGLCGE